MRYKEQPMMFLANPFFFLSLVWDLAVLSFLYLIWKELKAMNGRP